MEKLIDITTYPVSNVLSKLLEDKATKQNIIWATDTYSEFGEEFTDKMQMNSNSLLWCPDVIRPRIQKTQEEQEQRTRKNAEVFTPVWLCNLMNNYCDEEWFCRDSVFNIKNVDQTWTEIEDKIEFPKEKKWQQYVDSRRLEITCGEAPFLVSRYDASTGDLIVPSKHRIGVIDRKIRIVNENTHSHEDWVKWVFRAFEATYGYEFQGDNVLIARINLLLTFTNYYEERWGHCPNDKLLSRIANVIAWNIWQMDGLKDVVPIGKPINESVQLSLFDDLSYDEESEKKKAKNCRIFNWRSNSSLCFVDLRGLVMGKKLFDYVIGNPPYQDNIMGENDTFAPPVYHKFLDASYDVAKKVELITPARFLFNAGSTPKEWNKKMLTDPHLKVLYFEQNSAKVFPNTDIKGGVCVTYRNESANGIPIGTFTPYEELNSLKLKVENNPEFTSIMDSIYIQIRFNLDALYSDYPAIKSVIGSDGKDKRFEKNIFKKAKEVFSEKRFNESDVEVVGILNNKRVKRYIMQKYVDFNHENIQKFKVIIPASNGSGAIV